MGQMSTATGFELVIPGYFMSAGVLVFAALVAFALGFFRGRVPLYLAFAAACLSSAGVSIATAAYYMAYAVDGAIVAQRWLATLTLLVVGSIVAFIHIYTEARGRGWLAAVGAALAILIAANHILPLGLRFSAVNSFDWIHLPWGEVLFHVQGETGAWSVAYRGVMAVVTIWTLLRLRERFRAGGRREAVVIAAVLLLLFVSSLQAALIDHGFVRSFHWSAFALVGLALIAGASLVMRLREDNLELVRRAAALTLENEGRRKAEADMRSRAHHDSLTGLHNRAFLNEHLELLVATAPPGSHGGVLLCDIDHFKVINDGLGHAVGDTVLRDIAARLGAHAEGLAVLARMSGDTFTAVLDGLWDTHEEAHARIERLAEAFAEALAAPMRVGERSLNVGASIGIASFALPGTGATEILGRAEMALNRAKKRGRNNIQAFVPALRQAAAERYAVVEGLRRALAAGELTLHYQPLFDVHGKALGAEALMRWRSASLGDVPPASFIPIAEETGLIHALGEWSLREGCLRLAGWKRERGLFPGRLSVNVSPWQLARPEFVDSLRRILSETGADPASLVLEITESAVLFDVDETVAKLRDIRPLGVGIALDDFGTGYSSLALIKDLPLDAIKIDQSFVRNLDVGANQHLIRVMVTIGAELGLDVVAEGVESAADFDTLVALGCTRLQGYYFSRPLPEDEFARFLRSHMVAPERVVEDRLAV